jgi:hypothetical protein
MVLELASVGTLVTELAYPAFAPVDAVPVLFTQTRRSTRARAAPRRPTPGMLTVVGGAGSAAEVRIVAPPSARPCLHWSDPLAIAVTYSEATRGSICEGLVLSARVVRVEADVNGLVIRASCAGDAPRWAAFAAWVRGLTA